MVIEVNNFKNPSPLEDGFFYVDFISNLTIIIYMKKVYIVLLIIFMNSSVFATEPDSLLDNNTAFYEGDLYSYIIAPPVHFKMNSEEATDDGYSFAFIPTSDKYADASMIIGINIFKIKKSKETPFTLEMLITDDTTSIRKHFGNDIDIAEVEAIQTATTDKLRTIYFNSKDGTTPNVMMSYFDGKSEILIFDLTISEKVPRFQAEKIYLECLNKIKILTKGKLEVG